MINLTESQLQAVAGGCEMHDDPLLYPPGFIPDPLDPTGWIKIPEPQVVVYPDQNEIYC